MALRFILLVAACVQLSLAIPACSPQVGTAPALGSWLAVAAPASAAWDVPAAYPSLPSWLNAPVGTTAYGAVAPWKTPAPVASLYPNAHPWNNGVNEHPWTSPAIAPASAYTGSPAVVAPQETNYNSWAEKNSHTLNIPTASGSAAPAEHSAPQLPAPVQLPSPIQLPTHPQIPSINIPSSSLAKNHPLQSSGALLPQYGPGLPSYAPIQIPHVSPASQYGPGLASYAPIQVPQLWYKA